MSSTCSQGCCRKIYAIPFKIRKTLTQVLFAFYLKTKFTYLFILDGPDSIQLLPNMSLYVLKEASPLNMTCLADCFPTCTYDWVKQESMASITTNQHMSIENTTRDHSGIYECTAINEELNQSTSINLTVLVRCKYIF